MITIIYYGVETISSSLMSQFSAAEISFSSQTVKRGLQPSAMSLPRLKALGIKPAV
jgi:hypothetical protein